MRRAWPPPAGFLDDLADSAPLVVGLICGQNLLRHETVANDQGRRRRLCGPNLVSAARFFDRHMGTIEDQIGEDIAGVEIDPLTLSC